MKNVFRGMIVLLATTGCADAVEHSSETNTTAIRAEKHLNGLRYIPLRENHPEAYSAERAAALYGGAGRKASAPQRDIAELSDRELIEHMSGLTLIDHWIYRVEPELETARAARQAPRSHVGGHATRTDAQGEVGALTASLKLDVASHEPHVQRDNTEYPYSTIVYLYDLNPPPGTVAGGTGVMIGRYTLLSAAHNFWDGANFRSFDALPGADIEAADPFPFGGFECYGVVVADTNDDPSNIRLESDYAVVDFHFDDGSGACPDSPGDIAGWMGIPNYSDEELGGMTASMYGYPIGVDAYPQLWGGTDTLMVSGDTVTWLLNTSPGTSGGPVYVTDENGWPGVVALVSRTDTEKTPWQHKGPQINSDVMRNINAWSSEY
jgi:V8-like Glu-specific endopeptidase